MRETGKMQTGFWWGDLRQRDYLEDLDIYKMIILKWIFKKIWLTTGQVVGSCECGNEP